MPKQQEQVRESQDQRNSDLWCETQDVDDYEEEELNENDLDGSDIELSSYSEDSCSPMSISKVSCGNSFGKLKCSRASPVRIISGQEELEHSSKMHIKNQVQIERIMTAPST